MKKYRYIIGIDTGVNTGYAIWHKIHKKLVCVKTCSIHEAMWDIHNNWQLPDVLIRVEDARQRTWFGKSGREQLQGAGSIKRDAKIWEDFLKDLGVDFEMVPPKSNKTKLDSKKFQMITGWKEKTNVHGRDAAMLCFGY